MHDIPQADWDSLAVPTNTPLLEWDWLDQLEQSGSIQAEHGWLPNHLTIWEGRRLVGAAPLYLKGHSEGEFVWDYVWADVAGQLGTEYYPKLVGMSPATPAVGYRFLFAPGEDEESLTAVMLKQIGELAEEYGIPTVQYNFVEPSWRRAVENLGYVAWEHQSYLWENEGFESFDDYLAVFNKNQRKNIRKERRSLGEQGLRIAALTGSDIPDSHFEYMWRFYENTNDQFGPWAAKYLNREFFLGLAPRYRHRLLFVAAYEGTDTDPVALSFLIHKNDHLIGRYWGAERTYNNLHFNACYYAPIEWAIEHGVRYFDPGAGSPHKIRRGFRAVSNHSLHRFVDRRMQVVMKNNIHTVNGMAQRQIRELNSGLPFKNGATG
jgi:hypothetical protein